MLSIILPCYNEQDNLEFLFNSLDPVAAAHQNLEIILVNNGSTDNSLAVFEKELAKRNSTIFKVVTVKKKYRLRLWHTHWLKSCKGRYSFSNTC